MSYVVKRESSTTKGTKVHEEFYEFGSAIIRSFAYKSLFIMLLGVARLKRLGVGLLTVLLTSMVLVSCGGYGGTTQTASTAQLKFRALVSQDISTVLGAGLIVIDAKDDLRANQAPIGSSTSGFQPTTMVVSNDRKITLSLSNTFNSVQVVDNVKQTQSAAGVISLPGTTESMLISPDNATGYAAVPTAPVPGGGSSGGVALLNLAAGGTPAILPVPGAQFLAQSGDGSKLLVFSNSPDTGNQSANVHTVTIVSPFNILPGQHNSTCNAPPPSTDPIVCQYVTGFDHPIAGFFSSDNTQAWILNCGPECGGAQASVQILDLVNLTAGPPTPIPGGATVALIKGQTLYVAGNPAIGSNDCTGGPTTTASTCGRLTIVDLTSLPQATPIPPTAVIPDGYHTQLDISGNGQLFVGSRGCTDIVPVNTGDEQRGCLAIYNTTNGNLVLPPDNGDVTGLQPITNRNVVYVVEGGELRIYDTTTNQLSTVRSIDIFGHAVDVKLIDF